MTTRSSKPLIVGIGASAGGLEAFQAFLAALSDAPGLAIAFVQHIDLNQQIPLANWLAKQTKIKVVELNRRARIHGNTLYVCPPRQFVEIRGAFLQIVDKELKAKQPTQIDHLFHSIGETQAEWGMPCGLTAFCSSARARVCPRTATYFEPSTYAIASANANQQPLAAVCRWR